MTDKQLAASLRNMKVNTKGILCLGCEYDRKCSVHGCRLIGAASARLEKLDNSLLFLRRMRNATTGKIRSVYNEILSVLDPHYTPPPEDPHYPPMFVTDFLKCDNEAELSNALYNIDCNRFWVIAVTQDIGGTYTIFFHRPVPEQR